MYKTVRSWQGSNLRGQSPLDFKSNALTTRPQLLRYRTLAKLLMEMRGIEPRAFHMQSERSTTELHPLHTFLAKKQQCTDTGLYQPVPVELG